MIYKEASQEVGWKKKLPRTYKSIPFTLLCVEMLCTIRDEYLQVRNTREIYFTSQKCYK